MPVMSIQFGRLSFRLTRLSKPRAVTLVPASVRKLTPGRCRSASSPMRSMRQIKEQQIGTGFESAESAISDLGVS